MTKYLQLSNNKLGENSLEINLFDKALRKFIVERDNFKKIINPKKQFTNDLIFAEIVSEIPENSEDLFIQCNDIDIDIESISYNFFDIDGVTCADVMSNALAIGEFDLIK